LTGSTAPWDPRLYFSVSWTFLQTVGLLGRVISSSQGLYLNTGQHKHRINTYTHQTFMPCVGFEPTIPASERAKTVYVLDRSATVTGGLSPYTFANTNLECFTGYLYQACMSLTRQICCFFTFYKQHIGKSWMLFFCKNLTPKYLMYFETLNI
jgi:hypothetical protein